MNQLPVPQILKNAADKTGFRRVRYSEKKIPTSISNVTVFLFLGDIRSSFILSSLLLRRFREESKGSRYFILCSWPGHEALYPYVDEYWEISEDLLEIIEKVEAIYQSNNTSSKCAVGIVLVVESTEGVSFIGLAEHSPTFSIPEDSPDKEHEKHANCADQ